jgi:hypothetical protein
VTRIRLTPVQLSLAGFIAILLLTWVSYQPALSGAFQLDDAQNLVGLAVVEDSASFADFVLSGTAGPGGRPLALLSFAMQADEWQNGAEAFLRVNILIHLFNAVILAACLYQLSLLQSIARDRAAVIAAVAAGCWVLMPLLATASLLVVQRMTTLSALFALLGLLGYLMARRRLESSPTKSMVGMSVSLGVGTVLSMLCKETGVLLPVLVLVLEATVLTRPVSVSYWRAWHSIVLVLPMVVIAAYLVTRFAYSDADIARRGFTGWERLLTEAGLLWVYLQKALLSSAGALGVYQPSPEVSHSLFGARALLSSLAWLVLTGVSIIYRRRWPLLALAVLWFLGAHSLESTVLPLELYFEHRNYLPIVGPVYAAVAVLILGGAHLRRAAMVLIPLYMVTSIFVLYSFASLSGDPSMSSRYWAHRYPDSVRAVTTMAGYQLSEEGPLRALSTIEDFVARAPQHGYLETQVLNMRCLFVPDADHGDVVSAARRSLPKVDFTYTAGTMLSELFSTAIAGRCSAVDVGTVEALAEALYNNPKYAAVPGYQQFHYKLMAGIARQKGQTDLTLANLEKAIAAHPSSELNMMMVTTLGGAGEFDRAREYIEMAMAQAPLNPMWAWLWRSDLEDLGEYIDELERYSGDQQ